VAPRFSPAEAHNCPPCSSTIVWDNHSPSPVPWGLDVTKGSKMCAIFSGEMPTPESLTSMTR